MLVIGWYTDLTADLFYMELFSTIFVYVRYRNVPNIRKHSSSIISIPYSATIFLTKLSQTHLRSIRPNFSSFVPASANSSLKIALYCSCSVFRCSPTMPPNSSTVRRIQTFLNRRFKNRTHNSKKNQISSPKINVKTHFECSTFQLAIALFP